MKDQTKEAAHVSGPILLGAGLLILGIVLLAGELLGFHFWSIMWPFIFIVPGGVLFISSLTSADGHGEGLAILGSIDDDAGRDFPVPVRLSYVGKLGVCLGTLSPDLDRDRPGGIWKTEEP